MVTGTVSIMTAKLTLIALSMAIYQVHAVVFKIEAEDISHGIADVMNRSPASNGKSLHRGNFDKGAIYKVFCMKDAGEFQILEVNISNDGYQKDKFEVFVDDVSYGMGESVAETNFGQFWSRFTKQGPFNKKVIDAGAHVLKIVVRKSDSFGIEFDYIKVEALNSDMQMSDFNCEVMCMDNDDVTSSLATNTNIRKAGITVNIQESTCPRDSNVQVKFYHNDATTFRLEAIPPNYRTLLDMGLEGMTQCEPAVSTLWKYGGFNTSANLDAASITLTSGTAAVAVKDSGTGSSEIKVTFSLDGPNAGTYLSNIGSVLTVKVPQAAEGLKIALRYKKGGSDSWSQDDTVTFLDGTDLATWTIPDYSWNEGEGNTIQLSIPHAVDVDYIELKKRDENGETVEVIWTSNAYDIEGVKSDFWWLSPTVMTVQWYTEAGKNTKYYHYIRVKAKLLPDSNTPKEEIFTLYQDGTIRMVPVRVQGQASVPFGSYFVIGQPDVSHVKPRSPIEFVELDVDTLEFKVSFLSGQGKLILFILQDKTVLDVKLNADFYESSPDHNPFMLLQSRYIDDGMSEIDHVGADGAVMKHLKDFTENEVMNGTSYVFYRRCISHLNTQSEGLVVHMLSKPDE